MPPSFSPSVNLIRDAEQELHYIPTANAKRIYDQILNDFKTGIYSFTIKRFQQAVDYEKAGFTWMDDERLEELIRPERIVQVKEMHLHNRGKNSKMDKSLFLVDVLSKSEGEGCTTCFI